ncbi:hypothetical protein COU17_01150 [Candidatus Kaiserbacteria bacterium CG10_big_fil_rev_8_21_14_0_10_49_17]|uniref:Phage holin family protein n=1 Tax=Candidatus Kaiserbacteria bacterium CG10_big_fil_rev_8_21_14_0_10_49_17 TaxID=1974609 RepID=A0A2M6WET8_9BACT|nr:MAG: hypothetical protein COU17_01150 [Candidatus Kaiserbacteria bacterium CG10_big_fil_rev_8_21_14_0_10_49_17]
MLGIIIKVLATAGTLLLLESYLPGIEVSGIYIAVIAAVILGVLNLIVRPVLFVLTLPITLLSFGLFTFVLNALLFWFATTFIEGFTVSGFVPAFIGALAITLVHWILDRIF